MAEYDTNYSLQMPHGKQFDVDKSNVKSLMPLVGDVVTFSFVGFSNFMPTKPAIEKIRTDISWGDVLRESSKVQLNGTHMN